jgi:hypothetical protein
MDRGDFMIATQPEAHDQPNEVSAGRGAVQWCLTRAAARDGRRIAFEQLGHGERGSTISFAALASTVDVMRAQLPNGQGPVAILLDDGIPWVVGFLAVLSSGRAARPRQGRNCAEEMLCNLL